MTAIPLRRRFALLSLALMAITAVSCAGPKRGPMEVDADAADEFTVTESGLKYRILRRGNGEKPGPSDRVTVDYSGWLDNGQVFDSSYNRREPTSFSLSGVVQGWSEGLQYVSEGGMIELEVPPELGYGAQGNASIPPNSTLHFKVELHEIGG